MPRHDLNRDLSPLQDLRPQQALALQARSGQERWGYKAFNGFYCDIRSGPDQVDAMDKALPNGKEMRERAIVADYLRHPSAPLNVILETLLLSADERLRSGDYAEVELLLQAVNAALDIFAP
ncbi:MAG TPA: hypothetical protein VIS10_06115 [Anaerolineales bacterium]